MFQFIGLRGKGTKAGSMIQELQINYIGYTGGVLYLGRLRSMYSQIKSWFTGHLHFLSPVVDCGLLMNPDNGMVETPQGTTFGQEATYTCNSTYDLVGDGTRTCLADGVWSGTDPTCGKLITNYLHLGNHCTTAVLHQ